MSVEIDGQQIASYTFVIIRGAVLQIPFAFYDDAGIENVLSASIIITPEGASEVQWTQGNGLFPQTGTGQFATNLSEANTTALTWDFGRYRLEIVDSSGFTVPCITEGFVYVKNC